MKTLNYAPAEIVIGRGSLKKLEQLETKRVLLVSGGQALREQGILDRALRALQATGAQIRQFEGISREPTFDLIRQGIAVMKEFQPDTVVAIGGGSVLDAAKALVLFYEHPELDVENLRGITLPEGGRRTFLVAIPSTSGTASEVTRTFVLVDEEHQLKIPVSSLYNKPDMAILDADIVDGLPARIAAETGMDALTHAIECYTRHDCDEFSAVLAKGATEGILRWLPESCLQATRESREKMHYYQCIAGMSFANVGVAAVHGLAHAVGAVYHLGHGLADAIILPYVMELNRRDPRVAEKLKTLERSCGSDDLVESVRALNRAIGIPASLREQGIPEKTFAETKELVAQKGMLGATRFNPVPLDEPDMAALLERVYWGEAEQRA